MKLRDLLHKPAPERMDAYGELGEGILARVRAEYTVMPRFAFHQPLDYHEQTYAPEFDEPLSVPGEPLPVPPPAERMGYAVDDTTRYLEWGRTDRALLLEKIAGIRGRRDVRLLDFGCSSGRVLRHFHEEATRLDWKLYGVDVQARPIEWIRRFLPASFNVSTCAVTPSLPFPDNTFDFIYGFSVFTHIKYLWDAWLLELRRIMRPGAVMIQTVHSENAWRFYHRHRDAEWVRSALPAAMLGQPEMTVPFLAHGDIGVSQVFWRQDRLVADWSRYLQVQDVLAPPEESFQDWVILRKDPE